MRKWIQIWDRLSMHFPGPLHFTAFKEMREVFWGTLYSRTNKKITTLYQPCLMVEILLCWIRLEQKNSWKWLNLKKYLSCSWVSVCCDTLQASSTNVQVGSHCTSPGTRWACHQSDKSQAARTAWLPKPASLWLTEKWQPPEGEQASHPRVAFRTN